MKFAATLIGGLLLCHSAGADITFTMAEKDGVDLMKESKIVRDGNKVRVYMYSRSPASTPR